MDVPRFIYSLVSRQTFGRFPLLPTILMLLGTSIPVSVWTYVFISLGYTHLEFLDHM